MNNTFYYIPDASSILHHGIKGQKWGERRYQNKDGSLTPEGLKRYRKGSTDGKVPKGGNWNPLRKRDERRLKRASKNLAISEQNYKNKVSKTKQLNEQYLNGFSGPEVDRIKSDLNKAHSAWSKYRKETGAFQPGDEGPAYKTMDDFKKGKIDKKGTELLDTRDKMQANYDSLWDKTDQTFDKFKKAENDEKVTLADLSRQQKQYIRASKEYIDTFGREKYDNLKLYQTDVDYAKKFVNDALDDFTEVLSGKKSAESFNRKYEGTGWKYTK